MKNILKENTISPSILWAVMIISVLIGTIIRFKGLGTWPLALDEYYIIKSTEYILEHGLPQFPNGGFYIRGILLQYMIAPLISIGINAELAGRLYTVIANLITIPPIYLIAKRVGNQFIAAVLVVIFSFSIWEIEFARFARMYTPFQAIFCWYIYLALVDFTTRSFKNYKWMLLLSAISFLVYEGSVFLAVFNFVPFVLNRKFKIGYLIGAVITFFASTFVNMFDFRTLNSAPIFPPQFAETIKAGLASSPIKLPKILLPFAFDNAVSLILTILLIGINVFVAFKLYQLLKNKNLWNIFSILFLTILAVLNQFGLFILSLLLMSLWNLIEFENSRKQFYFYVGVIFILNLIYWFGFGLLTEKWYVLFDDFSSYSIVGVSKRLLVGFFSYPDNYISLLTYFKALPILTLFSAASLIGLLVYLFAKRKDSEQVKFLYGTIIFLSLLATIPTLMYDETRYTFFFVPIVMFLVVYSAYVITHNIFRIGSLQQISFLVIIALVFLFSRDFNFYHLTNIDREEVNYRMVYENNNYKKHLYRRWDIKAPTDYVKNNMHENDLIMINENSHEYYLPKVDYYNFNYMHRAFIAISVNEGTKERWSNSILINNNNDLLNLIENRDKTIWFIVYPENWLFELDFYERYKNYFVKEGIDGMIKVFKFPAQSYE